MDTTTPPSLRELQLWMRWILTDPRGVGPALTEAAPLDVEHRARYTAPEVSALEWIQEQPPLPVKERLDIYAEAYFARLVDALAEEHPHTQTALGDDMFRTLVAEYLKANPSSTPDIGEVGRRLLDFVLTTEFFAQWGYLADTVRAENLAQEAFVGPQAEPFDMSTLTQVPPEAWPQARLELNPALRLIASSWNLDGIWQGEEPHESETTVDTFALIGWSLRRLSSFECEALAKLREGALLGDLLQDTQANPDEVMATFGAWLRDGTVSAVHFSVG